MKTKLLASLSITLVIHAYAGSATWLASPLSGEWNRTRNWNPMTIPNGPSDIATFATSSQTAITVTADTEVSEIVFNPGASPFTITALSPRNGLITLTISGAGVTNNSGVVQNFVAAANGSQFGEIDFTGSASAGSDNVYTIPTNPVPGASNTFFVFDDDSTAADSTFILGPYNSGGTGSGYVDFLGNSTAANAVFMSQGLIGINSDATAANATFINGPGGSTEISATHGAANATFDLTLASVNIYSTADHASFEVNGSTVVFWLDATAANGSFTLEGGTASGALGGKVSFQDSATAGDAIVTVKGGEVNGALGGTFFVGPPVSFGSPGGATGGNAIVTLNPGQVSGALGGTAVFDSDKDGNANCTAGNATVIANGGQAGAGGGSIAFYDNSNGGSARVEVFGNATLDVSERLTINNLTIGSLEGDGTVFLGGTDFFVGANDLDTTFSGVIQEEGGLGGGHGGSLNKVGTGKLTLGGTNTYAGGTTINAGTLAVSNRRGSATGTGMVQVTAGTLGGSGTVSGAIMVGTSSVATFVAPALGTTRPSTLACRSVITFNSNSTYTCTFKAKSNKSKTDKIAANGVAINNGAMIALSGHTTGTLRQGLILTLISNTSANPISGTFSNLADGAIVNVNGNNFQASYTGGDGNDLTLTVVP